MDSNKKRLVILIVIVAIIAILLLELLVNAIRRNSFKEPNEPTTEEAINDMEERNCIVNTVEDFSNFETIRNCIYTYYQSYVYTNSENIDTDIAGDTGPDYYQNRLYGLLSKEYIDKNNITKDSIVCDKVMTGFDVDILSIYQVGHYEESYEDFGMSTLYIVGGLFRNLTDKSTENFSMALVVDNINMTYEIFPSDYVDISKYTSLKEGDRIEFDIPNSVEANEYNKFSIYSTSLEDYARYNFKVIKNMLMYNPDIAFEYLSDEGKTNFGSADNLSTFINDNRSTIAPMNYSSNVMDVADGILTLNCYDSNYRYKVAITFNGYSTFKYSIEKIK